MKKIWLVLLWPLWANAEQCVMQDRTVVRNLAKIEERSPVRRDIISMPNGQKRCLVDFRVRIGNTWHTAIGEHQWPGDVDSARACAQAVTMAEQKVLERQPRQAFSEQVLVCKDRPELRELEQAHPGSLGDIAQFRPHPSYPNRFWHNGVQCRWFVEPAFVANQVQMYQGVICEMRPQQWVVVDKF